MSSYMSIIKELEISRRLGEEIAHERQMKELERSKIEVELENLRRSRQEYINHRINKDK